MSAVPNGEGLSMHVTSETSNRFDKHALNVIVI